MLETVSSMIGSIEQFLRYLAPGFVALGLVVWAFPALVDQPNDLLRSDTGLALISGTVIGIALNSAHRALFEDLLCLFVHTLYGITLLRDHLPKSVRCRSVLCRFKVLERRRHRRRFADDGPAQRFQKYHDGLGATLTFLYCSSYPAFAIALYQLLTCNTVTLGVLATGLGFLFFGIVCDIRYICLDAAAIHEYRQDRPRESSSSPIA